MKMAPLICSAHWHARIAMLLHAIIVVSVTLVLASTTGQAVARVKKKAEGPIKAHPELGLSATMPGRPRALSWR
jgi:hypothetical protein